MGMRFRALNFANARAVKGPFSLRSILLSIIALAAIPPLVFSGILLQRYATSERTRAELQLEESARGVARAIETEISAIEAVLSTLATSPWLAEDDLPGFERQLRAVAAKTGRRFQLADQDGTPIIRTFEQQGAIPRLTLSASPERSAIVTDVLQGPAGRPAAAVIVPVQRDDRVGWSLQGALQYEEFRRILAVPGVPDDWIVSIVDRNGTHFIRSHNNDRFAGKPMVPELVAHLKQKKRGTLETTTLEGVPVTSAIAYAPRSGWAVAIGMPEAVLGAPLRERLINLLALGLPITALALGAGLLLASYLNRLIGVLRDMAHQVGAAKPVAFRPTLLRDANDLGYTLEQTSAELDRRSRDLAMLNATLEDQVVARTTQLSEANALLREEIARREQSEAQLRQSQKMEAVGQLTGGIAHDFNNMLAVVLSSLHLLRRRLRKGDTNLEEYIDSAASGAERAANLVRRLLTFSRQHPMSPETVDVNKLIAGIEDVLRRTILETIQIEMVRAGGLWRTLVDVNGLESVIVNLAVNARDAMPDGGKLTIETANAYLDEAYAAAHEDVEAGQYVMIALTDTGSGMARDVCSRAFEPFFTTKPAGSGTGLGLSQVYGFIKQSGGHVKIYSEVGVGTSVKLYLPRIAQAAEAEPEVHAAARRTIRARGSRQLVLVVEDDPDVRKLTVDMLRELNYETLAAGDSAAALELLDSHSDIALLFTDVVMPVMNGRKLADEAMGRRPDLKVLFTTGYTRNAIVHNGVLDEGVHLIVKPFTLEGLAAKLTDVFDQDAS